MSEETRMEVWASTGAGAGVCRWVYANSTSGNAACLMGTRYGEVLAQYPLPTRARDTRYVHLFGFPTLLK